MLVDPLGPARAETTTHNLVVDHVWKGGGMAGQERGREHGVSGDYDYQIDSFYSEASEGGDALGHAGWYLLGESSLLLLR